ncbi:MAG: Yip1 family protein [Nanoarchaeota archaeon]|nr:Yip1 family protein [Nanoarchaeota archaeon]
MVNQQALNYLIEGIKKGVDISILKQKLLEAGYKEQDVKEAGDYITNLTQNRSSNSVSQNKNFIPSQNNQQTTLKQNEQTASSTNTYEQQTNLDNQNLQKSITPPSSPPVENFLQPMPTVGLQINISPAEKMGLFKKIGKSFIHPIELFEKTKEEKISPAFFYQLFISIVPFLITSILVIFLFGVILSILPAALVSAGNVIPDISATGGFSIAVSATIIGILAVLFFIINPLFIFISAVIVHLFMKLYGGSGKYRDTYKAIVYSSTPQMLFIFIPFVGIWSFILSLFGLSTYHNVSKGRTFFAILSIFILMIILFLAMYILLLYLGVNVPTGLELFGGNSTVS